MGARIAPVSEPPAAGGARPPIRGPGARDAAGDPADRRHLLSDALDRVDALGASLQGGGGHRPQLPGRAPAVSGAPALDDRQRRGRALPRRAVVPPRPGDVAGATSCDDHRMLTELSNRMADVVAATAPSVVQVQGHRRPASGLVYADGVVVTTMRALGRE